MEAMGTSARGEAQRMSPRGESQRVSTAGGEAMGSVSMGRSVVVSVVVLVGQLVELGHLKCGPDSSEFDSRDTSSVRVVAWHSIDWGWRVMLMVMVLPQAVLLLFVLNQDVFDLVQQLRVDMETLLAVESASVTGLDVSTSTVASSDRWHTIFHRGLSQNNWQQGQRAGHLLKATGGIVLINGHLIFTWTLTIEKRENISVQCEGVLWLDGWRIKRRVHHTSSWTEMSHDRVELLNL